MSAPDIFNFDQEPVRMVMVEDEPVFVGRDVCNVVGIVKYRDAISQLDADERVSVTVDTLGGPQVMTAVTEPGVYALAMMSRSPKTKRFIRWLTHEVVPEIRRTGSYGNPADDVALPQNYVEALEALLTREKANLALERENAELTPRATAWDAIASAEGDYSVGEAAKMLAHAGIPNMGPQRLFSRLEDIGWTFRAAGTWQAKADRVEKGFLSIKPQFHYHPGTGQRVVDPPQVRVTLKGVEQLRRRLGGGNGAIQAVAS